MRAPRCGSSGIPGSERTQSWYPNGKTLGRGPPLGTYFVILFDAFALVGFIDSRDTDRVESHIEGFPEHRGEYASGSSYGTREQLKEQFPWLMGLTDETFDKCRRIRARQQLVWY